MRARLAIAALFASAAALGACSSILGLPDPALDDSIGAADAGTGGSASSASSSASASSSVSASSASSAGGGGGTPVSPVPVLLYSASVRTVLIDDTYLYWDEDEGENIGRMKKDGTAQSSLASGVDAAGYQPEGLAIDDTSVYWEGGDGEIRMCPKVGCSNDPTVVLDPNAGFQPTGLQVDAQSLYFANLIDDTHFSVQKMAKAGGPPSQIVAPGKICPTYDEMQLSGAFLYFTCVNGTIAKVATSNGAVELLVAPTGQEVQSLFISSPNLYVGQWAENGTLFSLVDKGVGSMPQTLALNQAWMNGLVADADSVYWTNLGGSMVNGGGSVLRCSLSDCKNTTTVLANGQDIPQNVVIDSTAVYWCNLGVDGPTPKNGIWRRGK